MITGAQKLIQLLEAQGIQKIAGIPGGTILPFYDALLDSSITHILARHEQGAAFIAQGMARSTGKPAVCIATSGPGATNLITGIADAFRDSIPIIAITAQVPRAQIGSMAFQEIDILSMARACTKACFRIDSASDLERIIPEAFGTASSGRPGPIWIEIPKDVFLEKCPENSSLPLRSHATATWMNPSIAHGDQSIAIHTALTYLAQAKRPLAYIGGGIISAEASAPLQALCARAQLPALSTLMGLGSMPSDDPLLIGMLGMHGHPAANMALERCDLLLVAGARFDDRATGSLPHFAPNAKVIHIDTDPNELGRHRNPELAIQGDLREILSELLRQSPHMDHSAWLAEIEELRINYPMPEQLAHSILHEIAATMGENCIVTTDVGQHQMWAAQSYPIQHPRQFLTSGGLGTMGFGLPTAIGAALENPHKPILCISGDGSILMNIQELATLAELQANVKICIFQNAGLGMVRQQQALFYQERYSACEHQSGTNFTMIARGFGIPACTASIDDNGWKQLLQSPGPAIIEFPIAEEEMVWPMVPIGKKNSEMLFPAEQTA